MAPATTIAKKMQWPALRSNPVELNPASEGPVGDEDRPYAVTPPP